MSKLTLTYRDAVTNMEESASFSPDAGGTYTLPILVGAPSLRLRLMKVNEISGTPDLLPFPQNAMAVQALRIPADWKTCHLTVVHDTGREVPKHVVAVIATEGEAPVDTAIRLSKTGKVPHLGLQILADHPQLPIGDNKVGKTKAAATKVLENA